MSTTTTDNLHVSHVPATIEHATRAAQAAAISAREAGLTEDECSKMYDFTYALELNRAN